MRLDVYLVEKGLFTTRNKAQSAIKDNAISINGKIISKPNYDVSEFDEVTIVKESNPYVSRLNSFIAFSSLNPPLDTKSISAF